MIIEYLLFLIIILAPRLIYLTQDGALTLRSNILLGLSQVILLGLIFSWNSAVAITVIVVLICTACSIFLESRLHLDKGHRLISLLILTIIPPYLASFLSPYEVSDLASFLAVHVVSHVPLMGSLTMSGLHHFLLLCVGVLILANETNIGIRAVFHHLNLEPVKGEDSSDVDESEYNAGRVIGILERWLMFLIVAISADLSALAFIIAAKGLARFEQLKKQPFAEYMLVGTLLSALSAVLVGFSVRNFAL